LYGAQCQRGNPAESEAQVTDTRGETNPSAGENNPKCNVLLTVGYCLLRRGAN